jgi:diguanylate cyclase (GGDEF)-like protein/PAS domain S-box-containing protein
LDLIRASKAHCIGSEFMEIIPVESQSLKDQLLLALAELTHATKLGDACVDLSQRINTATFDEKSIAAMALEYLLQLTESVCGIIYPHMEPEIEGTVVPPLAARFDMAGSATPSHIAFGKDSELFKMLRGLRGRSSGSFFINTLQSQNMEVAGYPCERTLIGVLRYPHAPCGYIFLFNAPRPYVVQDIRTIDKIGQLIVNAHIAVVSLKTIADEREITAELLQLNAIGTWEYNPHKRETRWSREMFHIHGLDPSTATAPSFDRLAAMVHPDDRQAWLNMIETAALPGRCERLEFRIIRPDGTERYLEACQTIRFIHPGDQSDWTLIGTVCDITERESIREALNRNQELLARTQKLSGLGTWEYIAKTRTTYWSEEMFALHGLDPAHGVPAIEQLSLMVVKEDRAKWLRMIEDVSTSGRSNMIEFRIIRPNGQLRWVLAHEGAVMHEESHMPVRFYGTLLDITEQKNMEVELRCLATTDALTQCYNRHMVMKLGEAEFDRARRYQRRLSLMFLDVDLLKTINDTSGHAAGDSVLVEVSKAIAGILRAADIFGRVGGDEFLIILPECGCDAACQLAERLRTTIDQRRIPIVGQNITVTVSTGVVELGSNDISFECFMRRADHALYSGKAHGRNRVVFEPALALGECTAA